MTKKQISGNPERFPPIYKPSDWYRYPQTPRLKAMPVPTTGIFDNPTRCLKINGEWFSHVVGMIETLAEFDAWDGSSADKQRGVDEILKLLMAINDCGGSGVVDCAQVDDCLPNTDTVKEIFKSFYDAEDVTISTTNIDRVNRYYAGGSNIHIYNQNAPYVMADTSDQDSINRLCMAVDVWLGAWRQKFLNYAAVAQGTAIAAATLSGYMAGVTGATGMLFVAVPFGLTSGWFASQVGVLQDYVDAYNDSAAYQDVLCELKKAFSSRGTTYTSYLDALASMPGRVTGTHQDLIADHLVTMLSHTESYLYLIDLLSMMQDQTPTGPDCTCVEAADCSTGTITPYPDATGFIMPDARLLYGDGTRRQSSSTGIAGLRMVDGSYFEIPLDDKTCVQYISFLYQKRNPNSSASGGVLLDIYVDGEFRTTFTTAGVTTVQNSLAIQLNSPAGFQRCASVKVVMRYATGGYGYELDVWYQQLSTKI